MKKYSKATQKATTMIAQAFLVYGGYLAILQSSNSVQLGLIAFGTFWVAIDVLFWANKYILSPAARAIYEANR